MPEKSRFVSNWCWSDVYRSKCAAATGKNQLFCNFIPLGGFPFCNKLLLVKKKEGKKKQTGLESGCCYTVWSCTLQTQVKKSQVSLSCLQSGLLLPAPQRAFGSCSWGGTAITKSVHVQSSAFPHPRHLVHIRPSVEGGISLSLSLNCLSWGFFLFFSYLKSNSGVFFLRKEPDWSYKYMLLWVSRALLATVRVLANTKSSWTRWGSLFSLSCHQYHTHFLLWIFRLSQQVIGYV